MLSETQKNQSFNDSSLVFKSDSILTGQKKDGQEASWDPEI